MLVVLLVMGLMVGLVSVTLRPDDRGLLRIESERLAQLLNLAADESRLTGKSIRWMSDANRYQFWRLGSDGSWSEIHDNDLLRARSLPQGMTISGLRVEAMRMQGPMRLEFAPHGSPLSFVIEISLGAEHSIVAAPPVGNARVIQGGEGADASLAQQ